MTEGAEIILGIEDMARRHARSGFDICPYCASLRYECALRDYDSEGSLSETWRCRECGGEWHYFYHLATLTIDDENFDVTEMLRDFQQEANDGA